MVLNIYNFIMLGMQSLSKSQAPPPPNRPGNVINAGQLPIDENLWILIGVGILFGVYYIYKRSHSTNKAA